MAIDTAEKRRSAAGVGVPGIVGPGVTPNSSKDIEWRVQAGWSYSGISAFTAAVGQRIRGFVRNVGRLMNP